MIKKSKLDNYWTYEKCANEALKYNQKTPFKKESYSAYRISYKNNWLDDICKHMVSNYKWNFENCKNEALKYNSLVEFQKESIWAYNSAKKNNWLDKVLDHMNIIDWSFENCKIEATKYSTRNDFHIGSPDAYKISYKNNWINDICKHMSEIYKPFKYWTYENCKIESLKYNTRNNFKKNCVGAYNSARNNKWLDEICSHMIKTINKSNYWTYENCLIESLKYNTRSEFQKNSGSAYAAARENNWLKSLCAHMNIIPKPLSDYTKEECIEEALKYNSKSEFLANAISFHSAANKNGWLKEVCSKANYKDYPFWTKERCANEALKYTYRNDFGKKSRSAYSTALNNGWVDEICLHMVKKGNKMMRCVYLCEFPDNTVYVGLTYNFENRINEHINISTKKQSAVGKYIIKTNLLPKFSKISDYVSIDKAVNIEEENRLKFISEGYNVLNESKCGSLGGKDLYWTYDRCKEIALSCVSKKEFREKYHTAYTNASTGKFLTEITSHLNNVDYWSYEKCKDMVTKYNTIYKLKKSRKYCYDSIMKNNWLNELYPNYEK